ncbi:ocs element-binding factor 1-like [Hibiscus syriacus]|uniref:Ocs element-binding factor 1-like n=1 Tax=Hibiscus syriacus TaxID=106335 RepID=A0A6A2WV69_HIBSY|nr:ocs element-binding factor 1-like [Hibiscus syriacus]
MLWPVLGILPTNLFHVNDVYNWATQVLIEAGGTFHYRGMWMGGSYGIMTIDPFNIKYMLKTNLTTSLKLAISRWCFDLQEVLLRFTFDIICNAFIDDDPECLALDLPDNHLANAFEDTMELSLLRFLMPPFVFKPLKFFGLETERQLKETIKVVHDFADKTVRDRRNMLEMELKTMVYLQAALSESLRLYPSVPLEMKQVEEDDVFPDGTRPEKWIKDGKFVSANQFKNAVFNADPRLCLGKNFAYTQMKMVVASVLLRYSIKVVEGHSVTTLYMKNGLMVTLEPSELQYDPEIEKTARRLRKETNLRNKQASYSSSPESESTVNLVDSSSDSEIEGTMANEERTLRELAAPNVNQQPLCIDYPALEEFHVVCSSMRPQGVTEEQIKLRVFPFSLTDRAKEWLFYLPPGSVTTWAEMVRMFLDKFFPASRAAGIRREICGIKQKDTETLHEYWNDSNDLLLPMERKMMHAASGGAIVNKTPHDARELISIKASNSQQFGFRQDTSLRRVNEVGSSSIEHQLSHLTSLVQQLVVGKTQQVKACGICATIGMSLEEIVKSLATNTQQFQQETRTSIQNLENQMSQLASSVSRLESQGKLPSQTIVNPKQNVSAITLRSGKELKEPSSLEHGRALEKETKKEVVAPQTQKDQPKGLKSKKPKEFVIEPPFPSRFAKSKKEA